MDWTRRDQFLRRRADDGAGNRTGGARPAAPDTSVAGELGLARANPPYSRDLGAPRVEPFALRPRNSPFTDSMENIAHSLATQDHVVRAQRQDIDALWAGVNGIRNSLLGRI